MAFSWPGSRVIPTIHWVPTSDAAGSCFPSFTGWECWNPNSLRSDKKFENRPKPNPILQPGRDFDAAVQKAESLAQAG